MWELRPWNAISPLPVALYSAHNRQYKDVYRWLINSNQQEHAIFLPHRLLPDSAVISPVRFCGNVQCSYKFSMSVTLIPRKVFNVWFTLRDSWYRKIPRSDIQLTHRRNAEISPLSLHLPVAVWDISISYHFNSAFVVLYKHHLFFLKNVNTVKWFIKILHDIKEVNELHVCSASPPR